MSVTRNLAIGQRNGAVARITPRSVLLGALLATVLSACSTMAPPDTAVAAARNQAVIASAVRTDQDRRMDTERQPASFLPFTQVQPGMRVLDVSAGAGYTSQLLALAVGPTGTLWAQSPKPGATLTQRMTDHPQANLIVVARPFEDPVPDSAPPLDLITIILNYHDISYLPVDRAKMDSRLFAALKPGGHLVVIDHAARDGTGITDGKTLHRIDEAVVLNEMRQAGFALEAESDFLRNRADPRDQTSADSKIPTDKFALRFVKPS
jgi:predicted methyltransferase